MAVKDRATMDGHRTAEPATEPTPTAAVVSDDMAERIRARADQLPFAPWRMEQVAKEYVEAAQRLAWAVSAIVADIPALDTGHEKEGDRDLRMRIRERPEFLKWSAAFAEWNALRSGRDALLGLLEDKED